MPVNRRRKRGKLVWTADYEDNAGKRVQRIFPTKEAAEDAFAAATRESRQRTDPVLPPTTTVRTYSERWLDLITPNCKRRTLDSYRNTLRLHILPEFGDRTLRDLRKGSIREFFTAKLSTHARGTVRIMYATLRAMLNAAIDDEMLLANPASGLSRTLKLTTKARQRTEHIKAMDRDQRDRFLTVAVKVEPRWATLWHLQVKSGLRPGEVYALQEADLDLDRAEIRVSRTLADDDATELDTPKSGCGRTVELTPETVTLLRRHLHTRRLEQAERGWRTDALFPTRAGTYPDAHNLRRAFRHVLQKADLPHFTPHGLRHTYATLLLIAGVDIYYVSQQLGHASIQLTVDTYGRWLQASRKEALAALDTPVVCNQIATGS